MSQKKLINLNFFANEHVSTSELYAILYNFTRMLSDLKLAQLETATNLYWAIVVRHQDETYVK
jgi:hypothetical protein